MKPTQEDPTKSQEILNLLDNYSINEDIVDRIYQEYLNEHPPSAFPFLSTSTEKSNQAPSFKNILNSNYQSNSSEKQQEYDVDQAISCPALKTDQYFSLGNEKGCDPASPPPQSSPKKINEKEKAVLQELQLNVNDAKHYNQKIDTPKFIIQSENANKKEAENCANENAPAEKSQNKENSNKIAKTTTSSSNPSSDAFNKKKYDLLPIVTCLFDILGRVRAILTSPESTDPYLVFRVIKKNIKKILMKTQESTTYTLTEKIYSITCKVYDLVQNLSLEDLEKQSLNQILDNYKQTIDEIFESLLYTDENSRYQSRFHTHPFLFSGLIFPHDQIKQKNGRKFKIFDKNISFHKNYDNLQLINEGNINTKHKSSITCLLLINHETLVTGSADAVLKFWCLNSFSLIHESLPLGSPITTLAFFGHESYENKIDGKQIYKFLVCGVSAPVCSGIVIDIKTFQQLYKISFHSDDITSIGVVESKNLIALGSKDSKISLWNTSQFKSPAIVLEKHSLPVWSLCILNSTFMLSGGEDRVIIEWKFKYENNFSQNLIKVIANKIYKGETPILRVIKTVTDHLIFFTAGRDNITRLWNRETGFNEIVREDNGMIIDAFICESEEVDHLNVVSTHLNSKIKEDKALCFGGPRLQLLYNKKNEQISVITIDENHGNHLKFLGLRVKQSMLYKTIK